MMSIVRDAKRSLRYGAILAHDRRAAGPPESQEGLLLYWTMYRGEDKFVGLDERPTNQSVVLSALCVPHRELFQRV